MLKHTSNAGGPANGHLRNNSNLTITPTITSTSSPSSSSPSSSTITSTVTSSATINRNIHLRPQQPLNISTLSASALSTTPSTSASTVITSPLTANLTSLANGGHRIPTLLSIPTIPSGGTTTTPLQHSLLGTGATNTTTLTPISQITSLTPLTPLTPNSLVGGGCGGGGGTSASGGGSGHGLNHNLHTYTNQHMLANHHTHHNTSSNNNNNSNNLNSIYATAFKNNHNLPHNLNLNVNNPHNKSNNISIISSNKYHLNPPLVAPTPSAAAVQQLHSTTATSLNQQNHHNYSNCNHLTGVLINQSKHGPGPREALTSLGLLCLVSLLLALLSLIFLLKISPNSREDAASRTSNEDFVIVYDVTLALCALSLSLNLCCLLVCAIQFLFAVKLVRSPSFEGRDNKYLEKSSASRTCAVGGFFISIPIFLTGIILYTFNHFHSTPAIITSVLIGIGIVFCGGAMVHNVFVWQKEKTISYRNPPLLSRIGPITPPAQFLNHSVNPLTINQSHQSIFQPASVTPVSPNHSHGSFNPLTCGPVSSSYLIRPATATPPTPKPILPLPNGCIGLNSTAGAGGNTSNLGFGGANVSAISREDRSSVSPNLTGPLDMSVSLHELSTLV